MNEEKKSMKDRLVSIMKHKKSSRFILLISALLLVSAVAGTVLLGPGIARENNKINIEKINFRVPDINDINSAEVVPGGFANGAGQSFELNSKDINSVLKWLKAAPIAGSAEDEVSMHGGIAPSIRLDFNDGTFIHVQCSYRKTDSGSQSLNNHVTIGTNNVKQFRIVSPELYSFVQTGWRSLFTESIAISWVIHGDNFKPQQYHGNPNFPLNPAETLYKTLPTGGKADSTADVKFTTSVEKTGETQYTVTLTKDWSITVNGTYVKSYWKYNVSPFAIRLMDKIDNDSLPMQMD